MLSHCVTELPVGAEVKHKSATETVIILSSGDEINIPKCVGMNNSNPGMHAPRCAPMPLFPLFPVVLQCIVSLTHVVFAFPVAPSTLPHHHHLPGFPHNHQ